MDSEKKRVVFETETDNFLAADIARPQSIPTIPGLVIKYSGGYIKGEKQANYVLVGFIVLAVAVSLFIIFNIGKRSNIPLPPGTEFVYPPNEPPRVQKKI